MIPKPSYVWEYTGSWPFSVRGLHPSEIENSPSKRLAGFRFRGDGWYEDFRCLVVDNGDGRYAVAFYDQDPRPAFQALAHSSYYGSNK